MAKAKAKAKSKAKSKSKSKSAPTLPSGYKVIGRAPSWDPEKNPVLKGVRGEAHDVIMNKGTKKEYEVRTMVVQDETIGAVTVWESAMLKDLFDQTDDGDNIRIEFLGLGEAKKGQAPPKLFSCGVSE